MKKVFAKDLGSADAGTAFASDFLLSSVSTSKTKAGKDMVRVTLADKSGSLPGVIWETSSISNPELVKDSTIAYVTGTVTSYQGKAQATITNVLPRSPLALDSDFEKCSKFDVEEMWSDLCHFVYSFENESIAKVARALMLDEQRAALFKRSPAATTMHHAFVGGLLEHTLQMLKMGESLLSLPFFKDLNRDLCMFGIMFHDFGKIYEYESTAGFKPTEQGILVGHIAKTCALVELECYLQKIPDRIRDNLQHVVLAHHGKLEYGSPVTMSTPEAVFVHHVDNMHGTVFGYLQKVENDAKAGDLTVKHGYKGEKVMVKRFNDVVKEIEENG